MIPHKLGNFFMVNAQKISFFDKRSARNLQYKDNLKFSNLKFSNLKFIFNPINEVKNEVKDKECPP
jgi:hypothetical protein